MSRLDTYVVVQPGLEELAAGELRRLGINGRISRGGLDATMTTSQLLLANLWLRTATRVLVRLGQFEAASFAALEMGLRHLDVGPYLNALPTAVHVSSSKSALFHTDAIAERVRRFMILPDDSPIGQTAPQAVYVRVSHDKVTVSVDASGRPLHRRGYRLATAKAPLRESVAAAVVMASGWDGRVGLIDPLCGAGTIAIEAALIAANRPPGRANVPACTLWPMVGSEPWDRLCAAADADRRPVRASIVGRDRDAGAIEAARANAERAGVDITWRAAAVSEPFEVDERAHVITNPPYGERISGGKDLRDLAAALGRTAGPRPVCVISPEGPFTTHLPANERVLTTTNGALAVGVFRSVTAAAT